MHFIKEEKNQIVYYTVPEISEAGFYNIFTTKFHGHSFEDGQLNFGTNCNDSESAILENYKDVLSLMKLTPKDAVKSKQTHSDITIFADSSYGGEGILKEQRFQEADGLITNEKNLAILIFFADCVPVLIADKKKKIIAAIHSGWKGTYKNIVGKAVCQLITDFHCNPEDLLCAIGPCISVCHFEVSEELFSDMTALYGEDIGKIEDGKYYLDLKKTVKKQLLQHNIPSSQIVISDQCTVCNSDLYSYRREGEKAGRMAAFIAIKE